MCRHFARHEHGTKQHRDGFVPAVREVWHRVNGEIDVTADTSRRWDAGLISQIVATECKRERITPPSADQSLADVDAPPGVLGAIRVRLQDALGHQLEAGPVLRAKLADIAAIPAIDSSHLGQPSVMQVARLFTDRADTRSAPASNVIDLGYRIRGPLNIEALRQACGDVVHRHQVLASCFPDDAPGSLPVRRCADTLLEGAVSLRVDPATADEAAFAAELAAPMDLAHGPLFRVMVQAQGVDDWLLGFAFEHIIFDGFSVQLWNREIAAAYSARAAGRTPQFPALPCQYYDHAAWQHDQLSNGGTARLLEQWRTDFGGEGPYPRLDLPGDDEPQGTGLTTTESLTVSTEQRAAIADKAQRTGSTAFLVWLTSLARALHTQSGRRNVGIVTPTAGRTTEESEHLLGYFANLAVIRLAVEDHEPFDVTLQSARSKMYAALGRDDLPFSEVLRSLHPERYGRHAPAPYCFLNVVGLDQSLDLSLPGLEVTEADLRPPRKHKRHPGLDVIPVDTGSTWRLMGSAGDDTFTAAQVRAVLHGTVREALNWAGLR